MSSGGPTIRMYSDKKTAMKRVRSIRRQTFSNPAPPVKRNVESISSSSSSVNEARASLAAKHPPSNVACQLAGVRILNDLVKDFTDLTEPEFERNFLVFPANPQLQHIARLLFLEPALHPLGHFATVPVEDDIPGPQAGQGRRAFGID